MLFFAFFRGRSLTFALQRYRKNQKQTISLQKKISKTMKILGIGNALVDELMQIPHVRVLKELGLPVGGMTLIDETGYQALSRLREQYPPQMAVGGSAGNAILAAAGAGADAAFLGRVAHDEAGQAYMNNQRLMGIENRLLVVEEGHTGICSSLILPDGERTFATYLGVAADLSVNDITPQTFEGCQLVHVEGYLVQDHALMERIRDVAQECGVLLSLDLASYNVVEAHLSFLRHLVEHGVGIVFANEQESLSFTGGSDLVESLRQMAGITETVVQKRGASGSVAVSKGVRAQAPGCHVNVVDTTGAGDYYAGGFLYAWMRGASLQQCVNVGSLLSSYVIQTVGAQLSPAVWDEVRKKLMEMF